MNRKKRREAGAIAIEAILSLSIFIMAILALMMGAMLVRAQSAMQYALDQTAKEVSGYFYLLDKIGVASMISGEETDTATAGLAKLNGSIEDIINFSGSVKDEAQELSATAENAISGSLTDEDIARIQGLGDDYTALHGELNNIRDDLRALRNGDKKLMFKSILQVFSRTLINKSFSYLVTPLVCEALVPKYLTSGDLDAFYRESGIHDIRFEGSEILADGRSINLVCTYKVDASRLTLGFYRKDLQFVQVASTAAWVRPNSSGSLVSLEKICANYDAEYAAAHSISVEEEPATTAASEASTDTTDSSTDTDTSDSTTGTDTTDESESSTTATTLSPEEQIFQQWAELYGLAPSQVDNIRHAYETFDDDLISAIGSCSNQMAAVFFVATYKNQGAKLLVAAGEDGMQVFNQLDAASRPVLIANTVTTDDAYVRALIAWIKSERITHNLTQRQIDQFAAQYRNGGGADPEAEVPERTTPEDEEATPTEETNPETTTGFTLSANKKYVEGVNSHGLILWKNVQDANALKTKIDSYKRTRDGYIARGEDYSSDGNCAELSAYETITSKNLDPIVSVGNKVKNKQNGEVGEIDIETERFYIEVKAKQTSGIKEKQLDKYLDSSTKNYMNLDNKKVILYVVTGGIDDPQIIKKIEKYKEKGLLVATSEAELAALMGK